MTSKPNDEPTADSVAGAIDQLLTLTDEQISQKINTLENYRATQSARIDRQIAILTAARPKPAA